MYEHVRSKGTRETRVTERSARDTYEDRGAPSGWDVSACLSVGVALERLPAESSPPPGLRGALSCRRVGDSALARRSRALRRHGKARGRAQPRPSGPRDWRPARQCVSP